MNTKQFVDANNQAVDPLNAGYATEAGHANTADAAKKADSATEATNADKASKADKLSTPRKIAGQTFDGTQDVTINAGTVGAYTKNEVDDKFKLNVPEGVNFKGIGLYIEKKAGIVTDGITGITTSDIGNGWYSMGTIPAGYRPKTTRSIQLMIAVGNTIMEDSKATITAYNNGEVKLRVRNVKNKYEIGGSISWIAA